MYRAERHLLGEQGTGSSPEVEVEAAADRRAGRAVDRVLGDRGAGRVGRRLERRRELRCAREGFTQRNQGASAGQLLVGLARSQLLGRDALVALDRQRADVAGQELSAVPALAAATVNSLARRVGAVQRAGIETGNAQLLERAWALLPAARRATLSAVPTIDMDTTDVEVYGRDKQGVAYNYCGQRAGRPHLVTWAQAGVTLAADLLTGDDVPRPRAAGPLRRALAALPGGVRPAAPDMRPRVRADAGYFTAELALGAVQAGCDFAIAATRNSAMWRLRQRRSRGLGQRRRHDRRTGRRGRPRPGRLATGVLHDHPPGAGRRRHHQRRPAVAAPPHPRPRPAHARPRRDATFAYAASFLVTNIPVTGSDDVVALEKWFPAPHRHRRPHPRRAAAPPAFG